MNQHLRLWGALTALLAAGCNQRPGWSQKPPDGVSGESTLQGEPLAVRHLSAPTIDGKLDEEAWKTAASTAWFVGPGDGMTPAQHPVAGFARLGWDDKNLYLGVVVEDAAPVAPFERDAQDPHLWERSSAIELMVQPGDFPDNREYFEIQVDTAGAVFDTSWDGYNQPITGGPDEASKRFGHMEWSTHAERAAYVGKGFYAIEAAFPWSSFTSSRVAVPPRAGDVWKVNLYTFRDGQRLALAWSPIRGAGNFHRSSRWGRVKFVP